MERGTGTDAKIDGISIAGKQELLRGLVNGEYSNSSIITLHLSVISRADNPQILITVILNNPKSGEYYGGKVAAPIFQNIANRIINFSQVHQILSSNDFVNVNYSKDRMTNIQSISD